MISCLVARDHGPSPTPRLRPRWTVIGKPGKHPPGSSMLVLSGIRSSRPQIAVTRGDGVRLGLATVCTTEPSS
jgi:hypothetical protein